MATGVGFSFDTSFLQNLEKADKKMEALMDKSNSLSASVVSAFSKMSKNGVLPYIESLESKIRTLNSIKFSIGENASSDMKKLKEETSNAIDVINKLLTTLKQRPEYYNEVGRGQAQKVIDEYNRELEATRNYTRQRIQMYSDMFDEIDRRENEKRQQNQQVRDNATQARANYESTIRMYEKMYDAIDAKEKEKERRYLASQKREEEAAARKAKSVIDQANRELEAYRNAYKQRQQMYEHMWREIERRESSNRRGDYQNAMLGGTGGIKSADQALRYADRIYSDRGLRSVNNMQKAIQQMQQAQNRLNLNTEEGKKKYEELGQKIKQVEKDLERLNTRAKSFGDIMKKVGYSVGVYFSISAMKNFGKKLVDVTKEFERQKVALQNLLQNKDEANRLWEKTVALAIKSPYTTQQLVTYTKQLAAYRIEHDKLYETTKMLADVSSGLGVEMNRMILAFGQVKAATYLRATELRQFTEAGVNMLDELARLYTELEGVEVKAGDVFERITKRQVVFSDVEEVFERLTSKGGMFFRMQETQAQTLYGQWANLQDIYQVSLDEMGRSVRGGMVFVISTLRTLVENWRLVATAIESVGMAWVAIKVGNWIATLNKADRTARMLTVTFGNLRKIMLSWQGAVGVLGVLASVLYNYFSNLSQVNQRYVDLRRGTIDNSIAFEQLAEKVEKNNEAIEMYDKLLKDSTKTEEEINNIQKERNKVIGENNKLLAEAKNKYEDLLPYVQENANGTLNFDKAIQVMQNRERAYLILQQKAKATLLRNALDTNIGDWREEYNEAEEALIEYQTKLNDAIAKGNGYELFGDQLVDLRELYTYIKDLKSIDEFKKALEQMPEGLKTFALYNKYAKSLRSELSDASRDFKVITDFFVDNSYIVTEALDGIDKDLTFGVGEASKIEQKKAGEAFDKLLERLGVVDEEVIKKIHEYVNSISSEKFGIKLDFNYNIEEEKELLDWQKRYNEFIEKLTEGKNVAELRKISSFETETDNKIKELDEYIKDQENIINRGETKGQQRYTQEEIDRARELLSVLKEARDWFGKNTKETKKEESEELKRLKEKIKFVRQLADDYEEMWKKYGKAYADANIKSDARRAAATELELNIDDLKVGTRQDEKTNLQKLLPEALGIEDGKVEVEKAVADVEVEVRWNLQEQANANLSREFENLFGNYELSLELEKLNIPPDLAKQLFGIGSIDLTTLRKELLNKVGLGDMAGKTNTDILNSNAYKNLNEHQRKELADHLQKVSQMEQKEQEERLKELVEYMRKEQDIRIKLKLEEINKLKDIDESNATEQQKLLLKSNVKRDYAQKIKKAEWDEFTKTPYIVQMFDDLDSVGTTALENLGKKLKTLKKDLYSAGLPASELKEILDKINKVEDELNERNPFRGLSEGFKNVFGGLAQARKEYEKQLEQQGQADLSYKTFLEAYNDFNETYGEFGGDPEARKLIEVQLRESKNHAEQMQKTTDEVAENYSKAAKSVALLGKRISSAVELTQQLAQSAIDIADSFGAFSEKGSKEVADSAMSILSGVGGLAQAGIKMASGDWFGGITSAVTSIAQLIIGINQTGDAMKQMKIEKELKLVQTLEKQYEKLEKAMESAYSIDYIKQYNQEIMDSLDQQIEARNRMIALEESKKKSDKESITGWKDEINDLLEKRDEAEKEYLQKLGGVGGETEYGDIISDFVDAWLEGFLEVGDGLDALNEHFDDFVKNIISKQLAARVVSSSLQGILTHIDKSIANDGIFDKDEWTELLKRKEEVLPQLNEALSKILEEFGATEWAGKQKELGSLSAGIQGMSAEQADVLTGYLNSIRFFVADSNTQLKALVTAQGLDTDAPNPMLSQLLVIAEQTRAIRDLFDSVVVGGHKMGRSGIKVFID